MEIYRIKHKPTGIYFMPSRGHMNLSLGGKVYTHPNGWNAFSTTTCLLVNAHTALGKKIKSGEIVLGSLIYPKNIKEWNTKTTKWEDLPEDTNEPNFMVKIDHSEWEKEVIK